METCHRLRGIAIELPDKVRALIVSPERVDEFANRGLQDSVSMSRQDRKQSLLTR